MTGAMLSLRSCNLKIYAHTLVQNMFHGMQERFDQFKNSHFKGGIYKHLSGLFSTKEAIKQPHYVCIPISTLCTRTLYADRTEYGHMTPSCRVKLFYSGMIIIKANRAEHIMKINQRAHSRRPLNKLNVIKQFWNRQTAKKIRTVYHRIGRNIKYHCMASIHYMNTLRF